MYGHFSRRRFLAAGAAAASLAFAGDTLLDRNRAVAARPAGVRRNVGGMSDTDPVILTYRKAIAAMRALPATDPRSWSYQAAIHGTLATPVLTAWNTCTHGSLFFWSWHRMYLYWFERIVRKMAGDECDSCWTLPYWDWSSPSQRQLPPMFRDPASELFVAIRNPAMNSGSGSLPGSAVDYAPSFSLVNFASASGTLEGTPHGAVHGYVGGWMGSVPTAAQDPIFYLHHCNIDRLWNLWLAQGGGRSDPLGDPIWGTRKFTFFDENAFEVQMTSCQVLRAAEQLYYAYEGEPAQVNQYCGRVVAAPVFKPPILVHRFSIPPTVLDSAAVTIDLPLADLRGRLSGFAPGRQTLFLVLDEVEAERPPEVVWEVHLGVTRNSVPQGDGPGFIGNVALFGAGIKSEAHHEFTPARFAFPIRGKLLDALASGAASVPLTFVARGVVIDGKRTEVRPAVPVRIGNVSLAVETQETAR